MKESAGITNQLLWPERDRLCNYFPGTSIGSPDPILQACAKGAGADRVPSRRFDELCGQSFRLVSSGRNVGCSYPQRCQPQRPAGAAASQVRVVINLKTARALGITVPMTSRAKPRADQVRMICDNRKLSRAANAVERRILGIILDVEIEIRHFEVVSAMARTIGVIGSARSCCKNRLLPMDGRPFRYEPPIEWLLL
jgi:hypothetical protein